MNKLKRNAGQSMLELIIVMGILTVLVITIQATTGGLLKASIMQGRLNSFSKQAFQVFDLVQSGIDKDARVVTYTKADSDIGDIDKSTITTVKSRSVLVLDGKPKMEFTITEKGLHVKITESGKSTEVTYKCINDIVVRKINKTLVQTATNAQYIPNQTVAIPSDNLIEIILGYNSVGTKSNDNHYIRRVYFYGEN